MRADWRLAMRPMVTTERADLSARYVLAVTIGARRDRVSERKHRRESLPIANGAGVVRRLSLDGVFGPMLIEGSSLRRRDT